MIHLHERQKIASTCSFPAQKCKIAAFASNLPRHNHRVAKKLLADGRGVFVPFDDAQQKAEVMNKLLSGELLMDRMIQRVYNHSRAMTWQNTGQAYRNILGARRPLFHTFVRLWHSMQRSIKDIENFAAINAPKRIHYRKDICL